METNCSACKLQPVPASWGHRLFEYAKVGFGKVDPLDVGVTGHCDCFTYLRCPQIMEEQLCCEACNTRKHHKHDSTILVAFDGVQNMATKKYGIGVYFADGSPLNLSEDPGAAINDIPKAQITAATRAVDIVKENLPKGSAICNHEGVTHPVISRVIFKTDSNILVNTMTKHVYEWEAKGKKATVKNLTMFRQLIAKVKELEKTGVQVLFWSTGKGDAGYQLIRDASVRGQLVHDFSWLQRRAQQLFAVGNSFTYLDRDTGEEQEKMLTYYGKDWCIGAFLGWDYKGET